MADEDLTDPQAKYERLGRSIYLLTEAWDRDAYGDDGIDPQWASASDFIEAVFEKRVEIFGPTEAAKKWEGNA